MCPPLKPPTYIPEAELVEASPIVPLLTIWVRKGVLLVPLEKTNPPTVPAIL